jgi:hypothetical protein
MSNLEWIAKNNKVTISPSGFVVEFASSVADVISFEHALVVRLDPSTEFKLNENVFGVNQNGKIAWTVTPRKYVYEHSPYVSIARQGNAVLASNWDGGELLIDPLTGRVLSEGYSR